MMVHFRTRNRHRAPGGPDGGYCFVYGRFPDWPSFEAAVTEHFRIHYRYDVIECDQKQDVRTLPADPAAASLVMDLAQFPIQYCSMHLYRADQAAQ